VTHHDRSWIATVVGLAGSALTVVGGLLHQWGPHVDRALAAAPRGQVTVPSPTASNAGLGLAVVGLLTAVITPLFAYLDRRRQDSRARWEAELKLKQIEIELVSTRRQAAHAEDRATAAEGRLVTLESEVPVNTVRIAATDGKIDGALEVLRQKGILAATPAQSSRPRPTLLVVEDDPDTAKALMKLFTARGYSVSHAATLDEGLRMADMQPHWLILDLGFPDGDGLDLLRHVRAVGLTTRVAILTGLADATVLAAAQALAPDLLFRKPVDFDDLLASMSTAGPPAPPAGAPRSRPAPPAADPDRGPADPHPDRYDPEPDRARPAPPRED
jgi:ActR/RegA family two-component response regulator